MPDDDTSLDGSYLGTLKHKTSAADAKSRYSLSLQRNATIASVMVIHQCYT